MNDNTIKKLDLHSTLRTIGLTLAIFILALTTILLTSCGTEEKGGSNDPNTIIINLEKNYDEDKSLNERIKKLEQGQDSLNDRLKLLEKRCKPGQIIYKEKVCDCVYSYYVVSCVQPLVYYKRMEYCI